MKLSGSVAELTRAEWRELGFFYDRDDQAKEWRLTGSRQGLLAFATLLEDYSSDPRNVTLSEHDHFGPHMYLEVMTSHEPGLDDHAISGSLPDLARLGRLVRDAVTSAPSRPIVINRQYAPSAEYSLVLNVREDGFDPASMDPQL
jgi:hypothetical protein